MSVNIGFVQLIFNLWPINHNRIVNNSLQTVKIYMYVRFVKFGTIYLQMVK